MTKAEPLVCIVDDIEATRRSMERLVLATGRAVETYASGREFLARPSFKGPVCLVLDCDLGDVNGLEIQRQIVERGRGEQVVFIAESGTLPACVQAMKAGAVDYLQSPVASGDFIRAVEAALRRATVLRDKRAIKIAARERMKDLTPRQIEVLMLVLNGRLNREIALKLGAAEATIKIHRRNIMDKLNVQTLPQLIVLAHTAGIISQGNNLATVGLLA